MAAAAIMTLWTLFTNLLGFVDICRRTGKGRWIAPEIQAVNSQGHLCSERIVICGGAQASPWKRVCVYITLELWPEQLHNKKAG